MLEDAAAQGHAPHGVGRHQGRAARRTSSCGSRSAASPLPGDPVIGFITRGRGVTVHRRDCDKGSLDLDPERRIECSWSRDGKMDLPVTVRVVTADRPGILASISRQFNESGVNITEATCRASVEGRAINTFQFQVDNVTKLKALMRKLSKVDGVYEVERS